MDKEPIEQEDLDIEDDYYDKEREEDFNDYRAQLMEDWLWS